MTTELTIEHEQELVRDLQALVADRSRREQAIESEHIAEMSAEQQQYNEVFQLLTETYETEAAECERIRSTEQSAIVERWDTEAAQVQEKFEQTQAEIDEKWTDETTAARKERDESGWLLASLLDEDTDDSPLARLQSLQLGLEATLTEVELSVQTVEGHTRQMTDRLKKCRILGEATTPEPSTLPVDLASLHQTCVEAARKSEEISRSIARHVLPNLFRGIAPLIVFLLIAAGLAAAIWMIPPSVLGLKLNAGARDWQLIAAGAGAALAIVVTFILHFMAAHAVLPDFERLMQLSVDAETARQRWIAASRREYERQEADLKSMHEARERKRLAGTAQADNRLTERLSKADSLRDSQLQSANSHFPARLSEIEKIRQRELDQSNARFQAACHDQQLRREQDFRHLQAEYDQRVNASRQKYQLSWQQLMRDWHGGIQKAARTSEGLCQAAYRSCPDWAVVANGWMQERTASQNSGDKSEIESPDFGTLGIGRIVVDLEAMESGLSTDQRLKTDQTRFELPVLLSLSRKPSLIVKSKVTSREAATHVLQTAMLRYLTSLPAGKVRFTILDPIGLGANFATFMHLSDIDEQMVTSRIWTEPAHIEKRLADLTEHMETVLQTYLRNEYATLDDYNHAAGEVAEPYRILVIANFPSNFTDLSLRRLMSIVEGGVKCGVFVLMSVDENLDLPRGVSLSDLERHATVLQLGSTVKPTSGTSSLKDLTSGDADKPVAAAPLTAARREAGRDDPRTSPFRLADPILSSLPLIMEQPPIPDLFGTIVRTAGELARSVRRVEVPFDRVMPSNQQYWTFSTRSGIDVPIGRAGATKLQNLRLGKGTSQHVLVAGKTGSGKSSLLHALITNAALHYSPNEVEFYLIDFKKGVEFKTYASHHLPHARVIAIESDREFGVSVLQRLDSLLKDRGEVFRRAGVQDLPGYRDACPNQPMPRVLLVIDEFQEFFTEDDSLSQTAALLFDRLIRQGRAFGIHVILGSQTLAGAYSLARSTLGQIAVRIALQCSETDAHLILSEENTAARLLSRPGEAIYNDANGLVEGNHPFQVVWLDDEERETYLDWMQSWAAEFRQRTAHAGQRWTAPVVFEGNIPADPLLNLEFITAATRLAGSHDESHRQKSGTQSSSLTCLLGEAVALTGATQLVFGPRDGGPVLVVGRDDDAALGVLSSSILALAGQGAAARFLILDGSLPESSANKTWNALAALIPTLKIVGPRESGPSLQEIVEELHAGRDELADPLFVIVFDLARFRDLKKAEDDFGGFGGFDKSKPANPSALFGELVKDGPSSCVFPLVWCDGHQTAQRWLGRDLMNRFETRVLFAMNANDSSNLIDSPAAGRLGPNRALLYRGDLGTLDKFRPFKAPPLGWLDELRVMTTNEVSIPPKTDLDVAPTGVDSSAVAQEVQLPDADEQPAESSSEVEPEQTDVWTDIGDMNVQW